LILFSLSACGKEPQKPQSNSVSKKIAVQQVRKQQPMPAEGKIADNPKARKTIEENPPAQAAAPPSAPAKEEASAVPATEALAHVEQAQPSAEKQTDNPAAQKTIEENPPAQAAAGLNGPGKEGEPEAPATETVANEQQAQPPSETQAIAPEPSDLVKESLLLASTYDPTGRFDPFEPLFKNQTNEVLKSAGKGSKEKRKPQTPLERVALSQLKLTAIIRAPSGNRALVEDATGKGYVIQNGTFIGLNAGRVIEIDQDHITVEEEIENIMGELTFQNAQLKLQKPAGEL